MPTYKTRPAPQTTGMKAAWSDLTTLGSADWTSGGPFAVASTGDASTITLAAYNPGDANVLGPDGTNGVVVDPNGSKQQTPTLDTAPGFSWDPSTVTEAQSARAVGLAYQIEASPSRPVNTSFVLSCVYTTGSNPGAAQLRVDQGDQAIVRQLQSGAQNILVTSSVLASMPRRIAMVRVGGGVISYYSLSTGEVSAADFASMAAGTAPSGWVRLTSGGGEFYMSIQSTALASSGSYDVSLTNADVFAVLLSTSSTGDMIVEGVGVCWEGLVNA